MNNNIAFIKSTFPAFAGRQACSLPRRQAGLFLDQNRKFYPILF